LKTPANELLTTDKNSRELRVVTAAGPPFSEDATVYSCAVPLTAGVRLGSYEIVRPIGAGGMGEVCCARDTKLNRDVAIKMLPTDLAARPDAIARFQREAHAVAALSHPSILAIHDFGTADGVSYAVMELLEGESLRQALADGPLPPRRAVDHAIQIARGLAAAHHLARDLWRHRLWGMIAS
jgi:serine/threonine protein kinase